jgi:aldose 1-epimerase
MRKVVLDNGLLAVELLPAIGGAMARMDWVADGVKLPVLRPWTAAPDAAAPPPRPNQLACFALLPWSNRLAGGFSHDGVDYAIAPNRAGDEYPIHGEGWLLAWTVSELSATQAVLTLDHSAGAPFNYVATMRYALHGARLDLTLEVRNTGETTLPYGVGLHPFMPRSAGVILPAHARSVWRAGADKLPTHAEPPPAAWDFATAQTLPADAVDHVFEGWDGSARVAWPETGLSLSISADTGYFIAYTPVGADFFCFEPVDHLINAHNAAGGPENNGLTLLAPGATLRRTFSFTVARGIYRPV